MGMEITKARYRIYFYNDFTLFMSMNITAYRFEEANILNGLCSRLLYNGMGLFYRRKI